ncbi:ATP-dependent protease ATPase subunit HslU (Unfoldase HslU) [Durusdinium trenchii]|uniref:ATP-dependent protease ATPase subunit HslU (Unfoldase HslU) n=1 Tax=Durusdinium trenchii TaxID=1381693 RepID=A0ABP0LSZ5_9DINO
MSIPSSATWLKSRSASCAKKKREDVKTAAHTAAENRVLDALVGEHGGEATREKFRQKLRDGELDDREIELELRDAPGAIPSIDIPGMPGSQMSMINLSEMFGKAFQGPRSKRRMKIKDAYEPMIAEESDNLLDEDAVVREAIDLAQNDGIVFLDEVDKIARSSERASADVSREGVQRDLLPLIEGATVATKHGPVKTDHILFIASGAFHLSKPSDLLPELQGRLPIRVELDGLSRDDLRRILVEPEASLLKQYCALMATEGVTLEFTDDAADALADAAAGVNAGVENIGARRLATIMETVLDDVSFSAADRSGETIKIDAAYVEERLGEISRNADLSRYIL